MVHVEIESSKQTRQVWMVVGEMVVGEMVGRCCLFARGDDKSGE